MGNPAQLTWSGRDGPSYPPPVAGRPCTGQIVFTTPLGSSNSRAMPTSLLQVRDLTSESCARDVSAAGGRRFRRITRLPASLVRNASVDVALVALLGTQRLDVGPRRV